MRALLWFRVMMVMIFLGLAFAVAASYSVSGEPAPVLGWAFLLAAFILAVGAYDGREL